MAASSVNRALVYGGKGALGSTVVNFFKSKGWVWIAKTYMSVYVSNKKS